MLAEFPPQLGYPALRIFRKFLGCSFVLNGVDSLAGVIFEVAQYRFELLLQLTNLVTLLAQALQFQTRPLLRKFRLFRAQSKALLFGLAQFRVQPIQKICDVQRLCPEASPRGGNNLRVQSQPQRDVDARGRSRHAHAQLIGRLQRGFIEASRRIQYARSIGSVNLQRGVMRGNNRHRTYAREVSGDRDRQGRAFLGIGGRAQLVEENQ